jgi:hypothetical protein
MERLMDKNNFRALNREASIIPIFFNKKGRQGRLQ